MTTIFSLCLFIIQYQILALELPSSKYKSLLTKNYSKRWLQYMADKQSSINPYCNLCCLNITYDEIVKDCGFHTLCIFKKGDFSSNCKGFMPVKFTEGEKYTLLDAHNTLRNRVARGYESRGSSGPQPSAANMRKLEWDDELAAVAERWAAQCIPMHDRCRDVDRFPVGQNIAIDYASKSNHLEFIKKWYDAVQVYNGDDVQRFEADIRDDVRQYTQLVWAETYRVGCGRAVFQQSQGADIVYKELLICNYGPAGNIPGQPIYIKGTPCTLCNEGTRCELEYPGLCQRACHGDSCEAPSQPPLEEHDEHKKSPNNNDQLIDPNFNYNAEKRSFHFLWQNMLMIMLIIHSFMFVLNKDS